MFFMFLGGKTKT